MARTTWPEGLDDKGAITRLQSFLVNTAEGRRNIAEDRQYTDLRKIARNRTSIKDRLPELLNHHKSLDSFSAYIREIGSRTMRVEMVRSDFRPLLAALQNEGKVLAEKWTGRQSIVQQAIVVRKVSLNAVTAIDTILQEHERRHDNGGPLEPEEEAALDRLRELRGALDILIRLVEAEQPIAAQARKIGIIGAKALSDFGGNVLSDVSSISGAVTPVVIAGLTYALAQTVGMASESAAMLGAAASAGQVASRWKGK